MKKVAKNGSQEGKKKGKKVVDSNRDKAKSERRKVKHPGGEKRERVPEEIWFSTNLKTVRTHWGLDQRRMAARLSMTQPNYSAIEHNRRSPKLNTISTICNEVHIPVHMMIVDPNEFTKIVLPKIRQQ